jgi:peptidoglycan/LPS O-acetylase OafA/YrhL
MNLRTTRGRVLSTHTGGTAQESGRLHYLDWLRVLAILTIFIYHTMRFFNSEYWHVKNPTSYLCQRGRSAFLHSASSCAVVCRLLRRQLGHS